MTEIIEEKKRKPFASGPIERTIFARNFQAARKALTLSQKDVAEQTNLTQGFISEVERGISNISLDNMAKLAQAMGLPLHSLLYPNPDKLPSEVNEPSGYDEASIRKMFGHHFQLSRKRHKLSQEVVGILTGFIQAFISEVERGVSNISLDNMAKLSAVVGQPLHQLLNPRFDSSK